MLAPESSITVIGASCTIILKRGWSFWVFVLREKVYTSSSSVDSFSLTLFTVELCALLLSLLPFDWHTA